ncbi:hypothetical protein B5F78_16565 [Bacteroides sp. An279]|nr:hypothetical protein B5F78_16565 [Bacteroides sp. An279]
MSPLQGDGLSHSDTRGSKATCASPRIFAACHVLHRLREPRHPPCALFYFRAPPRLQAAGGLCFVSLVACHIMSQISFVWRITDSNR